MTVLHRVRYAKTLLYAAVAATMLLAMAATLVMAAPGDVTDPDALKTLAAVRAATAKYHDVGAAIDDGYVPVGECVAEPGKGGMGIHYVNFDRIVDPGLDPLAPEALLYAPKPSGLKLVGVEYLYAIGAPGAPIPDPAPPAPILFGRAFDGPMEGHGPDQPPHYDLHVWAWQANPAGLFAEFNPNVICP